MGPGLGGGCTGGKFANVDSAPGLVGLGVVGMAFPSICVMLTCSMYFFELSLAWVRSSIWMLMRNLYVKAPKVPPINGPTMGTQNQVFPALKT